jgi:hypothetical protein
MQKPVIMPRLSAQDRWCTTNEKDKHRVFAAYHVFLLPLELLHHKRKIEKHQLPPPLLLNAQHSKTCTLCMLLGNQIWVFMETIRQVLEAARVFSTGSKGTAIQKPGNNAKMFGSSKVVHKLREERIPVGLHMANLTIHPSCMHVTLTSRPWGVHVVTKLGESLNRPCCGMGNLGTTTKRYLMNPGHMNPGHSSRWCTHDENNMSTKKCLLT